MPKDKDRKNDEQAQKAYIYLVKTPSSNDLTVCAFDGVLAPGTHVVSPTKYGLDMGIVVGSAASLAEEKSYCPGCRSCRGACHFGPSEWADQQELAASGETVDGDVYVETCGERLNMGPIPEFRFVTDPDAPSLPEEAPLEKGLWDRAYEEPEMVEVDGDVQWISHVATKDEILRYRENLEREKGAISVCREKIARHGLDMKLVTAHFLLCESKVLFFFTSEGRVDFRELVKDLVSVFRMRIELRQIGARDEARVLGGLAVCGRDFCCHSVSDKLKSVTIRMAKEQNLSLNSTKISGPCGRLLCCLNFEYDFYLEEKQAYPSEGSRIKIGQDLFKVTEINILSHKMTVSGSEGRSFQIPRDEIYYNHEKERWEITREYLDEILDS